MDSLGEPVIVSEKNDFCEEMMKRLDLLRRNEHFCDVILEVGLGDDQARLKCHKIVLCAASPFFYNTLNNDMKENKEGVIKLKQTSESMKYWSMFTQDKSMSMETTLMSSWQRETIF